ncbi:Copine-8 [Blattella germanica]|nr:Copine-8 [Blattella germanica]
MAVHIKGKAGIPINNVVHSIPCHIKMDGDAQVSKFFNPYIKNDGEVLKASFRGYPLIGKLIQLPEGYRGIIVHETMKPLNEEAERNVHVTHSFKSFTYWNWDKVPSKNDAFLSALDWIEISEAKTMSAVFVPGTAAEPTSEVELSVSCRGLLGQDVMSKSDPMCQVQLPLTKPGMGVANLGNVLVFAEELAACRDEVVLQFNGTKLDKKDFFGKSDPFLVFHKSTEGSGYMVVHRTEVIKNTLNPSWQKMTIPVRTLCNGDYDRNIKVVCYDHESSGDHKLIGEFYMTLRQLTQGPGPSNVFQCIHPEKKKKKSSYTHSGLITLSSIEVRQIYSFMDYMKGGTQLHCSIAIDFTGSNGNPTQPNSLHFISNVPNAYEQAIQAVGGIIQDYDTDKLFPVLGFGARIPPDGQVSHEFFVNMNPTNPYCAGVPGVLDAYRNCIRLVQLYGPTNFSPVIHHVARFARSYTDGSSYFILLILTDGVITDMPQTIEVLDADNKTLSAGGQRAARDIVQFVPFNKFLTSGDPRTAKLRLAKEVLAEVPRQFVSYMKSNNIVPKPAQQNICILPPDPDLIQATC